MKRFITKIKCSKFVNTGVIKRIKDKIYIKYISPNEEKKTDKYRLEILRKFGQICDGMHWQLLSGAFLRFYRDGSMEGQDLDFFISDTDFEKIKDKFIAEGFKIKQVFYNVNKSITEYKFMYKNVEVDVFIMVKQKKNWLHIFTMERNSGKNVTKKVKDNLQIVTGKDYISFNKYLNEFEHIKTYIYKGVTFNGPENAENMLMDLYGKNWVIYDPTFNPQVDPINNPPRPVENAKSIVFIEPLDNYDF